MKEVQFEAGGFFAVEMKPDLYLISHECGEHGAHWGKNLEFGSPTGNSWLIRGRDRSLLLDSALPHEGFKAFAERVAQTPVQLVLTHAHFDHIYRLKEFDECWLHPDDEGLLRGQYPFQPAYEGIPEKLNYLREGDVLDIGNGHVLEVYHMPGHTDGSILLLDRKSRALFSGDTIARRLLYGLGRWVPVEDFIRNLERMKALDFDHVYTCHDRSPVTKPFIDYMIAGLKSIPETTRRINLLGVDFIHVLRGDEREEMYFDCVVPVGRAEEIAEALARL